MDLETFKEAGKLLEVNFLHLCLIVFFFFFFKKKKYNFEGK